MLWRGSTDERNDRARFDVLGAHFCGALAGDLVDKLTGNINPRLRRSLLARLCYWRENHWKLAVERGFDGAYAVAQRRVRGQQIEPRFAHPVAEVQVARFLGVRGHQARTMDVATDFLQSIREACGVASELHCSGIRQKLPLSRHGAFDQTAKEDADPADDQQSDADQRQGIIAFAAAG
jgi:hypothetical protein